MRPIFEPSMKALSGRTASFYIAGQERRFLYLYPKAIRVNQIPLFFR